MRGQRRSYRAIRHRSGRIELLVAVDAGRLLGGIDLAFEDLAVDIEHDLAEHLDQPAVGVEREPFAGERAEPVDRGLVEPDVEHGVHHAGHGELGAGTHGDEQGIFRIAEAAAGLLFDAGDARGDLVPQPGRDFSAGARDRSDTPRQ